MKAKAITAAKCSYDYKLFPDLGHRVFIEDLVSCSEAPFLPKHSRKSLYFLISSLKFLFNSPNTSGLAADLAYQTIWKKSKSSPGTSICICAQ